MRFLKVVAAALLIATAALAGTATWLLQKAGFERRPYGFYLRKISFSAGGFSLLAAGLEVDLKQKRLSLSSFVLSVPLDGHYQPTELPLITARQVRSYFDLTLKVLKKLPLTFSVDTAFIHLKGEKETRDINLYRIYISKNSFGFGDLEIFQNGFEVFELSSLRGKIKKGLIALSGVAYPPGGKVALRGKVNSENYSAFLRYRFLKDKKTLSDGLLKASFGGKNIELSVEGEISKGASFNLKGFFDGRFFSLKGKVEGWNAMVRLRGLWDAAFPERFFLRFDGKVKTPCGETPFGGEVNSKAFLAAAALDGALYAEAVYPFGTDLTLLVGGDNGTASLTLSPKGVVASFKELSLHNLCGLSLKGLTGGLVSDYKRASADLSLAGLSYKKLLSLKRERLRAEANLKSFSANATLEGSIGGKLKLQRKGLRGENIKGELTLSEKTLRFAVKETNLGWKKGISFSAEGLKVLYNSYGIKKINLSGRFGNKTLKVVLSGTVKGNLFANFKRYSFNLNLSGGVLTPKGPVSLAIKGQGDYKGGHLSLNLPDYRVAADFSYLKERKGYGGTLRASYANEVAANVELNLSNKSLYGKGTLKVKGGNVYSLAPFFYKANLKEKRFSLSFLPLCLYNFSERVLCLKTLSVNASLSNRTEAVFRISSLKGLPFLIDGKGKLEGKKLFFTLKGGVSTDFLNRVLGKFQTFIPQKDYVECLLSYSGNVTDALARTDVSCFKELPITTAYAYKPMVLYISAMNDNGIYRLYTGLGTENGQMVAALNGFWNASSKEAGLSWNLEDFPFRLFYGNTLFAFLKIFGTGEVIKKPSLPLEVKASTSFDGYVKVLSYKFPKEKSAEGKKEGGKPLTVNYNISFRTGGPLYIQTPNGNFLVGITGKVLNKSKTVEIFIYYGKLQLFGKTFYISNGRIDVKNDDVYLNVPMTLYTPDRTIYVRVWGPLPVENLKLDIYSVPPAPKDELLLYLISGGGGSSALSGLSQLPLAQVFLRGASLGLGELLNRLGSSFITGVKISFTPSLDPTQGLIMGVQVEKYFGDLAKIGYHWSMSPDPKATYFWSSVRFLNGNFLRFTRYSDNTFSVGLRFFYRFGSPYFNP
jgi:hypothetical protein